MTSSLLFRCLVLAVAALLCAGLVRAQVISIPASGSLSVQLAANTQSVYGYVFTGTLTPDSDVSLLLIATSGSPTVYVSSSTSSPSASNNTGTFTGSGSLLLQSSSNSSDPQSLISALPSGSTIYVTVAAGSSAVSGVLSVSATERISFSGLVNQSVTLGATAANTVQYVRASLPVQRNLAREYFTFVFSYTTNTAVASLSAADSSIAAVGPAVAWSHINFYQNDAPPSDPVLTSGLLTSALSGYRSAVFVTYDRDQSYNYNQGEFWYVWAVYLPSAVPAGAVISLANVASASVVAAANDNGGDDFPSLNTLFSSSSDTVQASNMALPLGSIDVYSVGFPYPAYFSGQLDVSLTTLSGNADLFIVPTRTFLGASVGQLNFTTGLANDAGGTGYAQGANIATNGYWPDSGFTGKWTSFSYGSTNDGLTVDTVSVPWVAPAAVWWTVVVFGQLESSYELNITLAGAQMALPTLTSVSGIIGMSSLASVAAGQVTFYQTTLPSTLTTLTDVVAVLVTDSVNLASAYISTTNQYPGADVEFDAAILGGGSQPLILASASGSSALSAASTYTAGATLYVAVYGAAPSIPAVSTDAATFTFAISATERIVWSGIANQSATASASPFSVQFITWEFEQLTGGYSRGYYSFALGASLNSPVASLIGTSGEGQLALIYEHILFDHANAAPGDPAFTGVQLAAAVSSSAVGSSGYQGGDFVVFDRDQSYQYSTTTLATYVFSTFYSFPTAATSVTYALSGVDSPAAAQASVDSGGDDFVVEFITIGQTVGGSVDAAAVVAYEILLPASASTMQATITLTSQTGNADLFVQPAAAFYNAATINETTGLPCCEGFGQYDGDTAAGLVFVTSNTNNPPNPFTYSSGVDGAPDSVSFTYSTSDSGTWMVIVVFGQRQATYSLVVAAQASTAPAPTSSSSSSATVPVASQSSSAASSGVSSTPSSISALSSSSIASVSSSTGSAAVSSSIASPSQPSSASTAVASSSSTVVAASSSSLPAAASSSSSVASSVTAIASAAPSSSSPLSPSSSSAASPLQSSSAVASSSASPTSSTPSPSSSSIAAPFVTSPTSATSAAAPFTTSTMSEASSSSNSPAEASSSSILALVSSSTHSGPSLANAATNSRALNQWLTGLIAVAASVTLLLAAC